MAGEFRFMFTARDYAKSVAFYRDDLALPLDHDWDYGPSDRGSVFAAGGGKVEIFGAADDAPYTAPVGIGMLIEVDDADAWHRRAVERGLTVVQPPTSFPWGHRVLRLMDPDGIVVSLFSFIPADH